MFQLEKWRELQRATGKTAASSTATKSKLMERKGGQGSPRGRLPREVIEVGVDGDGNAAGEDTAVGVAGKNDNDQIENIRDKMIKDMQEEIRLEQFNQMQKMQLEARQLEMREAQLEETQAILARHWSSYAENARILQLQENWTRYMTCDGLPDPGSLSDLNTFLHVATEENENASLDAIVEKCQVITNLISKVERIVRSIDEAWKEYVREYESIAGELRGKLQWWIDLACYRLLRDIEANMNREDTKTSRYVRESNRMVCCVWAPIALPVGTKRLAEKERKPTEVAFEEIKLTIQFPGDVDCHRMAVRGLWLAYDHYSVETNSRRIPSLPKEFWDPWVKPADLLEFARTEYREKLRIWEEQTEERRLRLEEKKGILRKMENPPVFPDARKRGKRGKKSKRPRSAKANLSEFEQSLATFLPGDGELLPYLPTPNEIVRQREEEARKEVRRILSTRCEKTEVNLRKYTILGGVFRLDLIQQPPQPKDLGKDGSSTTLELPKEPRFARFCRSYEPPQPPPDSERTPEVIEAEMKALEVAMESLLLISLQLPDSVFWFEPPLVAHWIPERNVWSTKDVHDIKYNEEKQTIAFRSGKLGVHGLVANKFANLPFQSWELRPEPARNGRDYAGVVLNVTAATVQAEFIVREDRVCLNSLIGGSSTPLKRILGEYVELETLIERMQRIGCDLFPERDAASYLKGSPIKHPVAENHLRRCMALLSSSYAFSWSRWNATRTFWEIVLQFKELHGCVAKERTNLTVLVTPWRTMRVRCTEVSPEFTDLPLNEEEDAKLYADLYQLAINTAGIKTRLSIQRISFKLVSTVARLLERTNVIGMSS
ncbi:dynein axonemal intermediate chain 7 isoform X5 [Nomia melanderi]|uniref:dynein axonemal intermediate chain 7 isoform X5 n=1 Tax=Nomia melanderi TaxID=2448451 RepID=UPI0013041619|nr:protein CASC1-like isoform X5 [Nomia melanderi]